jgi:hypothetical protein
MNSLGDLCRCDFRAGRPFWRSRRAAIVYYALCAVILGWAAFQRFHLAVWPLADPDTWGYLNPALSKLTGGALQHTHGRNLVYPGFLFLVLATFKSFAAITIVQHTLGLLTGGLLLGCWHQIRRFLEVGAVGRHTHEIAGVLLLAIYLLSSQPIIAEHQLRPEGITPFFAVLDILLTLKFIEQRYLRGEPWRSAWLGAAVVFVSFLLLSLKPSFGLTALFTTLPVLLSLFHRKATWIERLILLAAAATSALLLVLPEHYFAKSDPIAMSFLPKDLFYIHANLIADQMDEDIACGDCGERGCEWLDRIKSELREEMRRSWELNPSYRSLGFNPNYLMYDSKEIRQWREKFFQGEDAKRFRFYWYYAERTLMKHPARVLAKVWREMRLFYSASNPAFVTARGIPLTELYRRTVEWLQNPGFRPTLLRFVPTKKYEASCASLASAHWAVSQPRPIRRCNGGLARAYLPVFCAVLLASVLLLCSQKLRFALGMLWPATLLVYSYNFGTCLETAIIHSLDDRRYMTIQFSFTLLAEFVGIYFLGRFASQMIVHRRTRSTDSFSETINGKLM